MNGTGATAVYPGGTPGWGSPAERPHGSSGRATGPRRPVRRASASGRSGRAAAALTAFLLLGAPAAPAGRDVPTVAYSAGDVRASATLAPRPWGTALHLSVSGLTPGQNYTVWLERPDGRRIPAGSFTAQGSTRLTMELSSGMRPHNAAALGLSVSGGGPPVLRAPIPRS